MTSPDATQINPIRCTRYSIRLRASSLAYPDALERWRAYFNQHATTVLTGDLPQAMVSGLCSTPQLPALAESSA